MEVKQGYKQTDVGIIPEEWQAVLLDRVAKRGSGHTPDKKHPEYWNGNIKWISLADCDALDNLYIYDTLAKISPLGISNSSAVVHPAGTVVLSRDAGIGKSAIMSTAMAVSQHFMAWRCGPHLDNTFLYYWLQSEKSEFERIGNGSTIKTIGLAYFRDLKIPLPTHPEQCAIAEALSDVDGLLRELDRLIAKKRELKQATMQQLLTGQTRLPGFNGKWGRLNMAENSTLKARIGWQGLTTSEYLKTGDYFLVTGTDFSEGNIAWLSCCFVTADRYHQDRNIQVQSGDILLTKDGTIGKVAFIEKLPGPTTLNSGVFVIRPKGDAYVPRFFFYVLSSRIFEEFLTRLQAGSTITHLYQKDFVRFSFPAPATLAEQSAIAEVLTDMDAEITALEQRRQKTRGLKQAMMQELLTGKTRLR